MSWFVMLPPEISRALRSVETARRHGRGRSRSAARRRRKREERIEFFMRSGFHVARDWLHMRKRPAFGLRLRAWGLPVERITIK